MKTIKKILSLVSVISLLVFCVPVLVSAETTLDAKIETVYGGANGIVSMTFDDGILQTALVLDELCQKYDLYASLMLIVGRIKEDGTGTTKPEDWIEIFEHGHLEPQNHSMSHIGLNENTPDNLNDETFKREIMDSGDRLEEMFPDFDCITYANPGSGYNKDALAYVMTRYYMNRRAGAGSTPQSLDPGFEVGVMGDWSRILSPGSGSNLAGINQLDYLKGWIDKAAEGYWYCPFIHRVGNVKNTEIDYDTLDAWFAYIKEVRDRGDVWVTTASSATKYIRERQNSTASAKYDGKNITVSVEMEKKTADGLSLPKSVFNQPLTVRVEVPDENMEAFRYILDGECRFAKVMSDSDGRYALVDVIPNESVTLIECGENDGAHNLKKVEGISSTCNKFGMVEHYNCQDCGKNFDEDGNLLSSTTLEVFGEHKFEYIPGIEPTESAEGRIAHQTCSVCEKKFNLDGKEIAKVTLPKLEPKFDGMVIIISVTAAVVLSAAAVTIFVWKRKKR